ncbi:hypothetical protein EJB05_26656, partial [Eragrostis curvula]
MASRRDSRRRVSSAAAPSVPGDMPPPPAAPAPAPPVVPAPAPVPLEMVEVLNEPPLAMIHPPAEAPALPEFIAISSGEEDEGEPRKRYLLGRKDLLAKPSCGRDIFKNPGPDPPVISDDNLAKDAVEREDSSQVLDGSMVERLAEDVDANAAQNIDVAVATLDKELAVIDVLAKGGDDVRDKDPDEMVTKETISVPDSTMRQIPAPSKKRIKPLRRLRVSDSLPTEEELVMTAEKIVPVGGEMDVETSVEKTVVTEPTPAPDGDGQENPEETNQEVAESHALVLHPSPSPAVETQMMSREDPLVNQSQSLGSASSSGPDIEKIIAKSREKTKFFKVFKSAANSLHEDLTAKQLKIQEQQEELVRLKAELSAAHKERAEFELALAAQPKLTKDDLDELQLLRRNAPLLRESVAKENLEAENKAKALSAALQEKDALKVELDNLRTDSDLLLTEKEEIQGELITLKGENTSLIQSAKAVCQFTWSVPEEMPEGPLHATLAQVPEALRAHCKSVAEYAARHFLGVVKSLYPKIDLASCKEGYAKGTTIERANQLSMEAGSCAEELVKDVPLSP